MTQHSQLRIAGELADNAAWLRALAVRLVGEGADDLVQDTVEAALRNPPEVDRPVRPWLRRVMGNSAKMNWRSASRRRARESFGPEPSAPEAADRGLARVEAQRKLLAAVVALAEPYQGTIIARFVDGLSAADIASRDGIPAATVRSRLKRGLEMLRGALEEQDGAHWRMALAPILGAPTMAKSGSAAFLIAAIALVGLSVAVALVFKSHRDEAPGAAPPNPAAVNNPTTEEREEKDAPRAPRASRSTSASSRFATPEARDEFEQAMKAARGGAQRRTKTYDFSGSEVDDEFELPDREYEKLDKNAIRAGIVELIPLFRECRSLAADQGPVSGTVVLDFVIDAEPEVGGYIAEVKIDEGEATTLNNPLLNECLVETFLSLQYIAPEEGFSVKVRYPLTFR